MFSAIKPRMFVKFAATTAYYSALTTVSTAAIDTLVNPQTESAEDNVELAGEVVGMLAWYKTRGRVTGMVDKVADWHIARKTQKHDNAV